MTQTATVCTALDTTNFLFFSTTRRGVQLHEEGRHMLASFKQQGFQVEQNGLVLILVDECRGHTCSAASACSPNAMHIIFDLLRHVKVDDMLNGRKIQTFRSHIRADQHVLGALLEGSDGFMAFLLIQAAVDGHNLDCLQQEVLVNIVHIRLVLAKNQDWGWCLLQAFQQIHQFGLLLHILHLLDNIQVGSSGTANVDHDRIYQGSLGEVLDLLWHGSTEQQGLPLTSVVVQGIPDLLLKTQVDHSIGLIQHQHLALC
mmetsp:Transcript_72425/g.114831  ORF Transcript_72425/g.114831 Transcript_72425/m.114831 type:complete len:258 (-) Transcript_72425:1046-1819(-)